MGTNSIFYPVSKEESSKVRPGDIIWQHRMPGGFCIFLGENAELDSVGEVTYRIYHPRDGYLKGDNAYYYVTLERRDEIIVMREKGERE